MTIFTALSNVNLSPESPTSITLLTVEVKPAVEGATVAVSLTVGGLITPVQSELPVTVVPVGMLTVIVFVSF